MSTLLLVSLLAVASPQARPQAPARLQTPKPLSFASDVRIIRLDVSVVDDRGRPVRGLLAEDFSISENGQPVELSVFEAIEDGAFATTRRDGDSSLGSLTVQAETTRARSPGQRIVIVADPSVLTHTQLARMRTATSDFITHHSSDGDIVRLINLATREIWEGRIPNDRLRLAALGRTLSRHPNPFFAPGGDGDSIANQIDIDMDPEMGESFTQSIRQERFLSRFARAGELLGLFEEILIQLSAIPGRKSLILISEGFPQLRRLDERLERTAHLAREAQTAIHFIDAFGLDGLLPEGAGQRMRPIFADAWERSGGSQDLAEATGGFVSRFANVLTSAVSRAAEETRSYYIVGYSPLLEDDGRFRRVKVKVDREGVTARTKKGYIAGGVDASLMRRLGPVTPAGRFRGGRMRTPSGSGSASSTAGRGSLGHREGLAHPTPRAFHLRSPLLFAPAATPSVGAALTTHESPSVE